MKSGLANLASPLVAFLIWELCSRTGIFDVRFFPPPSEILYHLFMVSPGEGILRDIGASLYRIFFGYVTGVSAGIKKRSKVFSMPPASAVSDISRM